MNAACCVGSGFPFFDKVEQHFRWIPRENLAL